MKARSLRALILQLYFVEEAKKCRSPGLKAMSICLLFRGLKPPAPSVIFDLQL
jgi:hypothetical protein